MNARALRALGIGTEIGAKSPPGGFFLNACRIPREEGAARFK